MRRAFSVSAYVKFDEEILLVEHVKQKAWVPIGGELKPGEMPIEALVREVEEEIGWQRDVHYTLPKLSQLGPEGFLIYEEHDAGPKGLHMNFAFLLKANTQEITPCDEFTNHRWIRHIGLLRPVPPNVLTILDHIWKHNPYTQ